MSKKLVYGTNLALLSWFFLDMVGLRINGHLLVTRAYREDGLFFLLYTGIFIIFVVKEKLGKHLLWGWLSMWFLTQWGSHWFYTFIGPAQGKIEYFSETIKLVSSKTVYIPDLYHLILHGLILISLTSLILYIVRFNKRRRFSQ